MKSASAFRRTFENLFAIDYRSLAAFRIAVAALLFLDVCGRFQDLRAHYSDFGILPRAALLQNFSNDWYFSLYFTNGTAWFAGLLLLLTAACAVAMFWGYRTRWATFLAWVLVISLHSRNPMVLHGSDILVRLLLFWGMFLPLGASYSLDRAMDPDFKREDSRHLSVAGIALLLQVVLVYWFTASLKHHPAWWSQGTAVYQALSIDQFATRLGTYLLQFPQLLRFFTFTTLGIEIIGPCLAFIPWQTAKIRTALVFLFIGMHLSFGLCLELGPFPWVSSASWLIFLPREFWDWLKRKMGTAERRALEIFYDGDCGFCRKCALVLRQFFLVPETKLQPSSVDPAILAQMLEQNSWVLRNERGECFTHYEAFLEMCRHSPILRLFLPLLKTRPFRKVGDRSYRWVASNRMRAARAVAWLQYRPVKTRLSLPWEIIVSLLLLYILLWNFRTLHFKKIEPYFPRSLNFIANTLRIDQYWNMFSPKPMTNDGWYVIVTQTKDGRERDWFQGHDPVSWEKPASVADTYANHRWRKYYMNIRNQKHAKHRPYFADYVCRSWNEGHRGRERIDSVTIYFMAEETLPYPQIPKAERTEVLRYSCGEKPEGVVPTPD